MTRAPARAMRRAMRFVGVDGCRAGWVLAWIEGADHGLAHLGHIEALFEQAFARAMIDMPIGLPAAGNRRCDFEARRLMGRCFPRVFTGARRGLWAFGSRAEAHRFYVARGEAGVSCQLWNLGGKIAEVDSVMSPARQRAVCECHPELVFLRLNGGCPLPSKKTREGRAIRRRLVRAQGFERIDAWLDGKALGRVAGPDDILDACACAIAARDSVRRVPADAPPRDAKGLRMEIWY